VRFVGLSASKRLQFTSVPFVGNSGYLSRKRSNPKLFRVNEKLTAFVRFRGDAFRPLSELRFSIWHSNSDLRIRSPPCRCVADDPRPAKTSERSFWNSRIRNEMDRRLWPCFVRNPEGVGSRQPASESASRRELDCSHCSRLNRKGNCRDSATDTDPRTLTSKSLAESAGMGDQTVSHCCTKLTREGRKGVISPNNRERLRSFESLERQESLR
jgi:hypothetical protein